MSQPVAAPAWQRKLIDLVYGHPRPWHFLGVAAAIGILWIIALMYLLGGFWTDETSENVSVINRMPLVHLAGPVVGVVLTLVLCGALLLYPVGVWQQWQTRSFYRRMFGSYYSEP